MALATTSGTRGAPVKPNCWMPTPTGATFCWICAFTSCRPDRASSQRPPPKAPKRKGKKKKQDEETRCALIHSMVAWPVEQAQCINHGLVAKQQNKNCQEELEQSFHGILASLSGQPPTPDRMPVGGRHNKNREPDALLKQQNRITNRDGTRRVDSCVHTDFAVVFAR